MALTPLNANRLKRLEIRWPIETNEHEAWAAGWLEIGVKIERVIRVNTALGRNGLTTKRVPQLLNLRRCPPPSRRRPIRVLPERRDSGDI